MPPRPVVSRSAFTLVELLIVIIILAIVASVVVPKFTTSSRASKEASLKSNLQELRGTVDRFKVETGLLPKTLDDLAEAKNPGVGLDEGGSDTRIPDEDWAGPYVESVPLCSISEKPLDYVIVKNGYTIKSPSASRARDGSIYSTW